MEPGARETLQFGHAYTNPRTLPNNPSVWTARSPPLRRTTFQWGVLSRPRRKYAADARRVAAARRTLLVMAAKSPFEVVLTEEQRRELERLLHALAQRGGGARVGPVLLKLSQGQVGSRALSSGGERCAQRSEWSPEELVEEAPGVRDPGLGAGQHARARGSWWPIRRFDARHITPTGLRPLVVAAAVLGDGPRLTHGPRLEPLPSHHESKPVVLVLFFRSGSRASWPASP